MRFKPHSCRYTTSLGHASKRFAYDDGCYILVAHTAGAFMPTSNNRLLFVLLGVYAVASLLHFVHNAEFLDAYPGLPSSWSRAGVYLAWLAMTAVGAAGALLVYRDRKLAGLALLGVYAMFGLDSLGHYAVAPLSAHTAMMNTTILLEVGAAGLVLIAVGRRFHATLRGARGTG